MENIDSQTLAKDILYYNLYYGMQDIFDSLYKKSKTNCVFKNLYDLIIKDENILLAYKIVKLNNKNNQKGLNNRTLEFWDNIPTKDLIDYIKLRLNYYQPQKLHKLNNTKLYTSSNPIFLSCIEDKIIQQCIKQILEPICEAKFYPHSYGFRPNRSLENAVAYIYKCISSYKAHYVVDIYIDFFSSVAHGKLIKQIWTLGIHDKKVISIMQAIINPEIENIGTLSKGLAQSNILIYLLANLYLNDLDWWIDLNSKKDLKNIYIVRYLDQFKILCKHKETAAKIYDFIKIWLDSKLDLKVDLQRSQITDITKQYTKFLGFKIKVDKSNFLVKSKLTNTTIKHIKSFTKIKNNELKLDPTIRDNYSISDIYNYCKLATNINCDFNKLIKSSPPRLFNDQICNYTKEGRALVNNNLGHIDLNVIKYLLKNPNKNKNIEFNDNHISKYIAQKGLCEISNKPLEISMSVHHITPLHMGGNDEFKNLVLVIHDIHKLIHATKTDIINQYLKILNLDKDALKKLNKYRLKVGNDIIKLNDR